MTEVAAFVAAGCALLRIPLDPDWAEGVAAHVLVVLAMGELLTQPALADAAEPAPVFRA